MISSLMLLPPHQLQPASHPVVSAHPHALPPPVPYYSSRAPGTTKSLLPRVPSSRPCLQVRYLPLRGLPLPPGLPRYGALEDPSSQAGQSSTLELGAPKTRGPTFSLSHGHVCWALREGTRACQDAWCSCPRRAQRSRCRAAVSSQACLCSQCRTGGCRRMKPSRCSAMCPLPSPQTRPLRGCLPGM